jgi:hypothetical protein
MKRRIEVLILFLLFSTGVVFVQAADPQTQLSTEKKNTLRKFDPVDVLPEARENNAGLQGEEKPRKKQRQTAALTGETKPAEQPPIPIETATPAPAGNSQSSFVSPQLVGPPPAVVPPAAGKTATTSIIRIPFVSSVLSVLSRLPLSMILTLLGLSTLSLVALGERLIKEIRMI